MNLLLLRTTESVIGCVCMNGGRCWLALLDGDRRRSCNEEGAIPDSARNASLELCWKKGSADKVLSVK